MLAYYSGRTLQAYRIQNDPDKSHRANPVSERPASSDNEMDALNESVLPMSESISNDVPLYQRILTTIAELDKDPRLAEELKILLGDLAKTDPLGALELCGQIKSPRAQENAINHLLSEWAKLDPVAALLWIETNATDLTRSMHKDQLMAAYKGYAEKNPQAAFLSALQLSETNIYEGRLKSHIMGQVIRTQVENGQIQEANQNIGQIEDPHLKNNLIIDLVDSWSKIAPTEAAAYLESLGPDATEDQRTALVRNWAALDPAAAADWLDALDPEDPALARGAREVIQEWSRYDLSASAEWLNSRPASPELDRAVAIYTYRAVQEDPAVAMTWAESVNNERTKNYLRRRVAAAWKEEDEIAFQSYLNNSSLSDGEKEKLKNANSWDSYWDQRRDWRGR